MAHLRCYRNILFQLENIVFFILQSIKIYAIKRCLYHDVYVFLTKNKVDITRKIRQTLAVCSYPTNVNDVNNSLGQLH